MDIIDVKKDAKGRWITTNGQRELDVIASQIELATTPFELLKPVVADDDVVDEE
jgi:ribosomal protein S19E (S16A)